MTPSHTHTHTHTRTQAHTHTHHSPGIYSGYCHARSRLSQSVNLWSTLEIFPCSETQFRSSQAWRVYAGGYWTRIDFYSELILAYFARNIKRKQTTKNEPVTGYVTEPMTSYLYSHASLRPGQETEILFFWILLKTKISTELLTCVFLLNSYFVIFVLWIRVLFQC